MKKTSGTLELKETLRIYTIVTKFISMCILPFDQLNYLKCINNFLYVSTIVYYTIYYLL